MSATRCTCVWKAQPFVRLLMDPTCPAYTLHVLRDSAGAAHERITDR